MKPASRPQFSPRDGNEAGLSRAVLAVAAACFVTAAMAQTVVSDRKLFGTIGSAALWESAVRHLGGQLEAVGPQAQHVADVGFLNLLLCVSITGGLTWLAGGLLFARNGKWSFREALGRWGIAAGVWWMIPGAWELLRVLAFVTGWSSVEVLLNSVPHLVLAICLAGSLAAFLRLRDEATAGADLERTEEDRRKLRDARALRFVFAAAAVYGVVFTAMNWQLYRGLLVPHGDSAMYEEHLWNLLHGKGFRSYLDPGLFLGEHIQVIHALLIPLYAVWPSHLLLELCSSAALASGALPVFFVARRHSRSSVAGMWMGLTYLLSIPMQFLDIAIDLKTFRPTSFVIPLLLFAVDQMERGRWKSMLALLVVTLSAQEDLALIVAPLGVWISGHAWLSSRRTLNVRDVETSALSSRRPIWLGAAIALGATVYLALALTVLIPHFRGGAEAHYTSYFGDLGHSPAEIAQGLFTQPGKVMGRLFSQRSMLYAVLLLLPYGFLPLRSMGRLSIALPLFGILCLMDTSQNPQSRGQEMLLPFHHFHAPLVPIIVWAAAAGLGQRSILRGWWSRTLVWRRVTEEVDGCRKNDSLGAARFAFGCALGTGLFLGLSPLSVSFWDEGSSHHWQVLYVPGPRAIFFPRVLEQIPLTARVASTDFVHPRFTHFERSYDYSQYRRKVSGYELTVPEDTDYIVIDTRHRYSSVKSPEDVRELREEPKRWELLPDGTEGYFLVLKRVRSGTEKR